MILPKRLKKGDKIGVVAPSGPCKEVNVDDVEKELKKRGFEVKMYESCYQSHRGYLSGEDDIRARDIQDAFTDDDIDVVYCLRGGYGAARILEMIDFEKIKKNPKVFVGISDITALHIALNKICGFVTYHGPTAKQFIGMDSYTEDSLFHMIGTDKSYEFVNPQEEEITTLIGGKCQGELVGGNLSLIETSLGTNYEIDTKGKILFIEETCEYTYNVDKMLNHLHMAGKFEDCVGIIFGDFNKCNIVREDDWHVEQIVEEIARRYNKPTIYNLQSGHCKTVGTVPLGAMCYLDADEKTVKFDYTNCENY